jgi:hypothetical protein
MYDPVTNQVTFSAADLAEIQCEVFREKSLARFGVRRCDGCGALCEQDYMYGWNNDAGETEGYNCEDCRYPWKR